MNCNKMEDQLTGYLLSTLNQEEREGLETHLSSCQRCQRRLAELKKSRSLFSQWKPVSPPPDLKQKVLDNIRAQKLIEEKTSKESRPEDIPTGKMLEWLKKRVNSEKLRIYKILTGFLGKEKGEDLFDYYLEEELREQMSAPPKEANFSLQAIAKSLNLEVEVKRLEGGVMKETIHNCPYIPLAKDLGMKINPCEAICLKQAKLREKFQPVKVELIKKLPNKEGECIFLSKPLESKPS